MGGAGRDTIWGGWGNDLSNADDVLITEADGGLNETTESHIIYIDSTAVGRGWFVDTTPAEDDGVFDNMYILIAIMHEMGHILGYQHTSSGLMQSALDAGVRKTIVPVPPEDPLPPSSNPDPPSEPGKGKGKGKK